MVVPPGFGHHSKFFLTGIHVLTGADNPANFRFLLAPHSKFCFWPFCAVYTVFRVFPSASVRRSRTFSIPRRFPSGHAMFRSAPILLSCQPMHVQSLPQARWSKQDSSKMWPKEKCSGGIQFLDSSRHGRSFWQAAALSNTMFKANEGSNKHCKRMFSFIYTPFLSIQGQLENPLDMSPRRKVCIYMRRYTSICMDMRKMTLCQQIFFAFWFIS